MNPLFQLIWYIGLDGDVPHTQPDLGVEILIWNTTPDHSGTSPVHVNSEPQINLKSLERLDFCWSECTHDDTSLTHLRVLRALLAQNDQGRPFIGSVIPLWKWRQDLYG